MYGHVGKPGDGNDFARAHYKRRHSRMSGKIEVEGEPPIAISGHGLQAARGGRATGNRRRTTAGSPATSATTSAW